MLLILVTLFCLYLGAEITRVRPELTQKASALALREDVGPPMRTNYDIHRSLLAWFLIGKYEYPVPTEIDIHGGQATNASLTRLQELSRLRKLKISGKKVTDEGLKSVMHLSSLREIDLTETSVSLAGLETLREALPHCLIRH